MSATTIVAVIHDIIVSGRRLHAVPIRGHAHDRHRVPDDSRVLAVRHGSWSTTRSGRNQKTLTSTGKATYPGDGEPLARTRCSCARCRRRSSPVFPVLSLLIVGSLILGATALEESALALAVGLAIGSYSSIFVATPLAALEGARAAVPRPQRTPEAHVARRRVGVDGGAGREGPG